ncbi:DUF2637 domain-containing protein [Streptomyces sp. NBC_01618]|uniref:DUF2637 domain-containing protein n=1 Tax=Streptomyces sp. NBC_01618 TaxID=2975900 RepID=UPI003864135F|nr:DUF2637 domain-containing protein [Streptomyces sp. NBC_01618]
MTTAALPRRGADTLPAPITPAAVPAAPESVPVAPAAVPTTPPTATRARLVGSLTRGQRITAGVIVLAALVLSGIGLYLSFEHVAAFAHDRLRFQSLDKARLFTVGVDVGILVLIALDLLLAWLRRPVAWIRYPVWLLTGATVVLNAASAAPETGAWQRMDYVAAFAHGVVPLLFIVVVEVGKTGVDRIVRPASDETAGRVPLHRWFLAPAPTFGLWRRMRLWAVPTYAEAVQRDQDLRVYRVMLERQYGRGWKRKAPADLRLPLTMAPYGLTIDEALALPRQAEEREAALKEAKQEAQVAADARAAERSAQAKIARLRTAGAVQAVEHEVAATTEQAAITARAELVATERAVEAEAAALETATVAEAEARRAAAVKRAAADRETAAETARRAAGIETAAAEERNRAAGILALEAAATRRAAEDKKATATALQVAAEAEERAAGIRARVAEIERRAVEAEDEARLSPRERAVRKVARLALARTGGDVEALPLEDIADALGVSTSTASERRREAYDLLASGYDPETGR